MEKKEISEMNEKELLMELVSQQTKSSKNSKILVAIMGIIAAIAVIVAAMIVPKALNTLAEAETLITTGQQTLGNVSGIIGGIEKLTGNVNGLVEDNTEAITEAMAKIKNIDFESLNKSIKEFSDVLEPLANFFNAFK